MELRSQCDGDANYPAGKVLPEYTGRWCMREQIDGIPIRHTWVFGGTGKSATVRLATYFSFTATARFGSNRPPARCALCRVTAIVPVRNRILMK